MSKLSKDWLTEKHIDFEYKKYLVLAYLNDVESEFSQNHLYPCFADLIGHYRYLKQIRESRDFLSEQFPKELRGPNPESLELEYERILEDDQLMQEIMQIIEFSLPRFQEYMEEGKKIFEFIESRLQLRQIGLLALRDDFGYLFISNADRKHTRAYRYELTLFESPEERYRGLQTRFVTTFSMGPGFSYESARSDLIKNDLFSGSPATFAIESEFTFPYQEALLPVAKRLLMRELGHSRLPES